MSPFTGVYAYTLIINHIYFACAKPGVNQEATFGEQIILLPQKNL